MDNNSEIAIKSLSDFFDEKGFGLELVISSFLNKNILTANRSSLAER